MKYSNFLPKLHPMYLKVQVLTVTLSVFPYLGCDPRFSCCLPKSISSLIPTFSQSNSHDIPTQGFWGLFSCRMKSRCIISSLTSILYFFGAPPLVSASQMQFSAHHTWLVPLLTGPSSQNATQCLLSCISWSHSKGVCCPLIQGLVATPKEQTLTF